MREVFIFIIIIVKLYYHITFEVFKNYVPNHSFMFKNSLITVELYQVTFKDSK